MTTEILESDIYRTSPRVRLSGNKADDELEQRLDQDRFEIDYDTMLGRGCWGVVNPAIDKQQKNEKVVVKRFAPVEVAKLQMAHRNLDEMAVMANEARKRAACAYVVPAELHLDKNRTPFVVMPPYRQFLSEIIEQDRPYEESIEMIKGLAEGIRESHVKLKMIHLDLKPDNIAIDDEDGRPILSDFGTATCASLRQQTGDPRDNAGCDQTRAPEMYDEDIIPKRNVNSYNFFALAYKILGKEHKYPFEDELKQDPNYVKNLTQEEGDKIIWKKIKKNIPLGMRKFFMKCGSFKPEERPYDGTQLKKGLEKTLDRMNALKLIGKTGLQFVKIGIPAMVAAAAIGYGIYRGQIHEPKRLDMPHIERRTMGLLYKIEENKKPQIPIEFEAEEIKDLPEVPKELGMFGSGYTRLAKRSTDNRVVAYLSKCYRAALDGSWANPEPEAMINNYLAFQPDDQKKEYFEDKGRYGLTNGIFTIVSRCLENNLSQAKTNENGKIDLEDVCATTYWGTNLVETAKKLSKSEDYARYRDAKYDNGGRVLPLKEVLFIDKWLAYIHTDPD